MSHHAEALRQQALLHALQASVPLALPGGVVPLAGRRADAAAGLRAYRANAQAVAERALATAYPVLAQMLGGEAMAALARDLWQHHPPLRGDLAWFGADVAQWLGGVVALDDMPWLADVARLEWALHRAHDAADATSAPDVQALSSADLDRLRVVFVPGSTAVPSRWPVLTLWDAHQAAGGNGVDLQGAREALAAGRGETAWVWRRGARVESARLDVDEAAFNAALLAGQPLGPALDETLQRFPHFAFDRWLTRALRDGWLAGFQTITD